MKSLLNWIGSIAFYVLSAGLVVYAGSRSLDFIQSTLPPEQKMIGWLGLLASEGGAIIWLVVFLKQSQGVPQKGIAVLMAMADMVGSIALFTFDTLIRSAQNGAIVALTQDDVKNVILALSGLIGLNLVAVFAFHVAEPENMRKMREDAAHDAVQSSLLQQIEDNADNLAKEMLPGLYRQWEDKFKGTFSDIGALKVGRFEQGKDAPIEVEKENPFVVKAAALEARTNSPLSFRWPWQRKARENGLRRKTAIAQGVGGLKESFGDASTAGMSSDLGAPDGGSIAIPLVSKPPIEGVTRDGDMSVTGDDNA